jgi:hypothetical protein
MFTVFSVFDALWDGLVNNPITTLTSMFHTMLVLDGLFISAAYIKGRYTYNLLRQNEESVMLSSSYSEERVARVTLLKEQFINDCDVYNLHLFERILLYGLVTCGANVLSFCNILDTYYIYGLAVVTIPYVQNTIEIKGKYKLIKTREIIVTRLSTFGRFYISRLLISFIRNLHPYVQKDISNVSIFCMYHVLDYGNLFTFTKSSIMMFVLSFLRNNKKSYYYYKACKYGYYYKYGYAYNELQVEECIEVVNGLIKNNKWKDITDTNVVNAIATLLRIKVQSWGTLVYESRLTLLKLSCLWGLLSVLHVLTIQFKLGVVLAHMSHLMFFNGEKNKTDQAVKIIGMYSLVFISSIEVVVFAWLVAYPYIGHMLKWFFFYNRYYTNIVKAIKYYEEKFEL